MDKYEWLLVIHVFGAAMLLSGAVAIAVFQSVATRQDRPSDVAFFFRLGRIAELLVNVGAMVVLVFGIWLAYADREIPRYEITDEWILAAIALWLVMGITGSIGGGRYKRARLEAERLAAAGDSASPELEALKSDRLAFWLSYASGAAVIAILVLMVWKPGAP